MLNGHRRVAAAMLLAAAAGLTVDALVAVPPDGVDLVVAARDLPAGHRLVDGDTVMVRVPRDAVPDGAQSDPGLEGARLSGALRRGEPVTDARLTGPGLLAASPPGSLAVPVRVHEPAAVDLVAPGDSVALLAGRDLAGTGTASGEVLVPSAVVLRVPEPAGAGLLGGSGEGAVVVLALDRAAATRVADAAGQRPLTLGLLP